MFRPVDTFLNNITMYRLVLYGLSVIAVYAFAAAALGYIPYTVLQLVESLVLLLAICYGSNYLCAKVCGAPVNTESQFITAFILFFILVPAKSLEEYVVLVCAALLAMGSKYLVAIKHKHVINPVAIALVLLSLWGRGEGIWWVGSAVMLPLVFVLSLLVLRKLRRFALGFSFLITALISTVVVGVVHALPLTDVIRTFFISGPVFFFMGIMLTEPLTTPPTKKLQVGYGVIVGLLFGAQFSWGPVYSSPELSLFVGNIFSYIVSPKYRLKLFLKQKQQLATNIFEFVFTTSQKVSFTPGQYFEWTLPHAHADQRGMRRYFTIASSPSESDIRLGVRIEPARSSSFKNALMQLEPGASLMASSLSGDFVLPSDPHIKLAFIAGGIGVTPFRSMIASLKDKGEKRDIVFFYANRAENEIAYQELFDSVKELGIKMVYLVNKPFSTTWSGGYTGLLTKEIIAKEAADLTERDFYISGSHTMVMIFKRVLRECGVPSSSIHTDFFPGL